MKAIILARVSTEEQMKEGQSIPAQLSRARKYANKKELIIKSEYQFDKSSLKDKRTKFEQVIKEIEKSKTKIALIVETVDRLQRGFKESVLLDDLRKSGKLELHFIRENLIIHKDSNSSEIQRWDLAVFVAKSYVLQISDNVKRTNEKMIANGKWIGKAPVGYMNTEDENSRRETIVDPVRSPYVIKMFELYATGNYSMRKIKEKMDKVGLRSNTKHPRPMAISMINNLLNNPFYYGMMLCKGKLYPHKYLPLISKHLFDKVQQIKAAWHKKPFKYASKPYILRGMIKCADCGCTITPETSKGYIYYSCTNYHKVHKKRVYVKENELLEPIYGLLDGIQLSDEQIKELVDDLKQTTKNKNDFLANSLLILRKEYDKLSNRLSKLQDDKYDGCITNDLYNQKFKEYTEKQDKVMNEMNRHNIADKEFYITANTVLNLAQRAREIFDSSEVSEKRQLFNFLLQNLELKDRNLLYKAKTPFDTVLAYSKCSNLLGTFLQNSYNSLKFKTGFLLRKLVK